MILYEKGCLKPVNYTVKTKLKKKEKYTTVNLPLALDIETTSIISDSDEKISYMYEWTIGYGVDDKNIYYGRTYETLVSCINEISELFDTTPKNNLFIYVHNLGYEFQFLHKYLDVKKVFALDERKPIKVELSNGIIFKDSYALSGMSLDRLSKSLHTHDIKKLKDSFNYDLVRNPSTPLTPIELEYCKNDVLILLYYIDEQIQQYNNNITSIPLTNTGRVRKFMKEVCIYGGKGKHRKTTNYKKIIEGLTLDPQEYKLLKQAFMGGFTHANAYKTGKTIENVSSIDFNSSYPCVMVTEKYPMSKGKKIDVESLTKESFKYLLQEYLSVFTVVLTDVESICNFDSYISVSKCIEKKGVIEDNGRVFKADLIKMSITNIDFKIIQNTYKYSNIAITEMYTYKPHYLPKEFIQGVLDLYADKTTLKGVEGKEQEYNLKKSMLNSTYGMTVTDIVRDDNTYTNGVWSKTPVDVEKAIQDYNKKFDRFIYYPWGVFITAYARANLWTGILNIGYDYIYSDTDSVKFTNIERHKGFIETYNKRCYNKLIDVCNYYGIDKKYIAPKTTKGDSKILGLWDFEGTYTKFKTLGAKRYMYSFGNDINITIAGLGKKQGAEFILKSCNNNIDECFNVFNNHMFVPSEYTGKLTHTYIDTPHTLGVKDYLGSYEKISTLSGVHLSGCSFNMSMSDKYLKHLHQLNFGYISSIRY